MRILLAYGLLSGGGCERRMGDICRWLIDHGDDCWIAISAADSLGLTVLHGQCGVPTNRVLYMEPGGSIEEHFNRVADEHDVDLIDHQWWGAGCPLDGWVRPAIATLHGQIPAPPPGYYAGILSVDHNPEHRHLRTVAPNYTEIWNWVNLHRFPYREVLGQGVAFIGRSFKMINVLRVSPFYHDRIDCYGTATSAVTELPENVHWLGWCDPADVIPRYRVIIGTAQVAMEAMAVGRHVICGQTLHQIYMADMYPEGCLLTPGNVADLAERQFSYRIGGEPTAEEVWGHLQAALTNDFERERRELRRWVERRHNIDTQIGLIRGFYEEVRRP